MDRNRARAIRVTSLRNRISVLTLSDTANVIGRDSLKNDGLTAVRFAVCLCEAVGAEGDPPYWRGHLRSVR